MVYIYIVKVRTVMQRVLAAKTTKASDTGSGGDYMM